MTVVQRVNVSTGADVADVSNVEQEALSVSTKNSEVAVVSVEMEVNCVTILGVVSIALIVTAAEHAHMVCAVDVVISAMVPTAVSINGIRTGVSSVRETEYAPVDEFESNVFHVEESEPVAMVNEGVYVKYALPNIYVYI